MHSAGDCVIIETDNYQDGNPRAHLFIVILDAVEPNDKTIIVPMCRIKPGYFDATTEVQPGEHDFVREPTYIDYKFSRIKTKLWLHENGRRREPPVCQRLLVRIQAGITKSSQTPFDVLDAYMYRNF